MPKQYYHFLKADMHAGQGRQKAWAVGETRTIKTGAIIPCSRGFHGSPSLWQALAYAPGPIACLVELDGDVTPHGEPIDKYAARSRTLIAAVNVERELQLFAADCAEHVLWIYERDYPDDARPRNAIKAARDFANGEIGDAARDAAWTQAATAARDAAATAARDAARAAAATAAWVASWAAAWAAARAAGDTAWAAAGDAAWAAEQVWQREQFEARFGGLFAVEA